jgi:hypothetical protein
MRASALWKVAVLAAAVGLAASLSGTAWARMKAAPGSCLVDKKMVVPNGMACSHHCDPQTQWCQQGWCLNGQWTQIVSCYQPVCSVKCGH